MLTSNIQHLFILNQK